MIASTVPDMSKLAIGGLAVAGGALLGAILSGSLVKLAARMVRRRQVPALALNGVRFLGAVGAGFTVYLFVFGPGGGGFGLGGPGWFGSGSPGSSGPTTTAPPATATATTGPISEPTEVLRIEMLGGARYKGEVRPKLNKDEDRFYLVDGIKEPQTLDEVRQRIDRNPQLKVLEIVIREKGSVAEGHEAVKELKKLAGHLTVRVIKPAGEG